MRDMTTDIQPHRRWAALAAALYIRRVTLSLADQGALERELATRFRAASDAGVQPADWVREANRTFEEWEARLSIRGPRIASFDVARGIVLERRRAA